MLNNHIHEAYVKAYQKYLIQEAEKGRNLKVPDRSRKLTSGIHQGTWPHRNASGNRTVLLIGKSISWFIERMNSLFSPRQPRETC